MKWSKVSNAERMEESVRRKGVSVSRSRRNPEIAYVMMPMRMASHWSANIYHDGGKKIAIEFRLCGDYAVRRTSDTAATVRINIPRKLVGLIPFGLHEIETQADPEGMIVIDLQAFE